jgi:peroxiredoxin
MKRLLVGMVAAWLFVAGVGFMQTARSAERSASLGRTIDDFTLRDYRGKEHSLADYADRDVLVVAFLGTDCPLVRQYAPRLREIHEQFQSRGVTVLGINANRQDSITEVAAYARIYEIPFPILKDAGNEIADRFGALRTPEVFVLDQQRAIRYRGRIDDQFEVGIQRIKATRQDLAQAITELLDDKPVTLPLTDAPGCLIGRVKEGEPTGDVTYSNQVARVLQRRCVECHREGEIAPFPLTSYDEVSGWADTILEVIDQGRMPPWFADPRHGTFSNDCRMTQEEKDLIHAWVENNLPEGDPAQLPEEADYVQGWRIPKPEKVYYIDEKPFEVAAEGEIEYQNFTIDPGFTEDVWIQAAEARPDNPAVVHHIVLFIVPPGADTDRMSDGGGFGTIAAVYAPGMPPWEYPEGAAMKVSAGSKFVIQMHYTSSGAVQKDRSYVGLVFADPKKVTHRVRPGMVLDFRFEIPAGADHHEVASTYRFKRDTLLLNLFPHMHLRGKSFRYDVVYPDGTEEVLLDVPNYDFNWQLRYDFTEPKLMPKGTRMTCTGVFDNSEDNLANPDPTRDVRFGLQTWQEMMVGYYTSVPAEPQAQD